MKKRPSPIEAGKRIFEKRYPKASLIFVAGSVVRGEGTAYSDLDLVVVYPRLKKAFRDSFYFEGWPVEAFVHDLVTLDNDFKNLSRSSGVPALPQMVSEGLITPGPNALSRRLKAQANSVLKMGPHRLSKAELKKRRYMLTDIIEDLRAPRNSAEMTAIGVRLYDALADYYFRSNRLWSGRGKGIPRAFRKQSPQIGGQFERAFEDLFKRSQTKAVIALTTKILKKEGGLVFDGYTAMSQAQINRRR